eukprot:UN13702
MIGGLSKARVLEDIKSKISLFRIPELIIFDTKSFDVSSTEVIEKITNSFGDRTLIVRSSASDEDSTKFAMAGEYESVLNVPANQPDDVRDT